MTGRLNDEDLDWVANTDDADVLALVAEVRERRAAEQRVRDVLREWDETEPEDGWGRMAEEITAALGGMK